MQYIIKIMVFSLEIETYNYLVKDPSVSKQCVSEKVLKSHLSVIYPLIRNMPTACTNSVFNAQF